MTTNKQMTGEQLDELMAVAVRMQRDGKFARDFPSANFAYAVQVAVLELRHTREIATALAAENAALKSAAIEAKGEMEEHHDNDQLYSYDADGEQMDALLRLCDAQGAIDEIVLSIKTPATDAFLAEVRSQESAPLVRALTVIANSEQHDGETVVCDFDTLISVAAGALRDHYAAQLRKGGAE